MTNQTRKSDVQSACTAEAPASLPLDRGTFTVGILGLTATVLLVGLLVMMSAPSPVLAIGQSDRSGDYVMLTMQLSSSTEGLLVTDAAAKMTLLYNFDFNNRHLEVVQRLPLDRLRKAHSAPDNGGNKRKP